MEKLFKGHFQLSVEGKIQAINLSFVFGFTTV